MSKPKALRGKDLMLFVGGKAVALATSHTLTLNAETSDTSSKDSGLWADNEVTAMNWEASSESVCSADAEANSYDKMMELALAAEPVTVILGIPTNITTDEVPSAGWTAPTSGSGGQKYYEGQALITSVQLNAQNGENATMSVSLTGKGALSPKTGAAAKGGGGA